ncbi:phage tail tube protein [Microbacterium halophytorum]|uniref:phage tail tube protein n=1 Tax=Microbacterium halophytorum TaxID=2067568 RepID=UPI000CFCA559|nr:IPT/TIG domain-containing protein [Microbacterium halophytorum]
MNRVPLPADTTLGKSFEYGLDINLGTPGTPQWQSIRRISAFAPTFPPTTSDIATYDDLGSPSEAVSGRGFATAFTVQGNRSLLTGMYLPEVERLIAASRAKGEAAVVDVRFYHKPENGTPNPNDAGRSTARVELSRQNTGNAEVEVFSITLTGIGEFTPIANPFQGWDATAPQVSYVGPEAAVEGDLITITGDSFLEATELSIDSVAVDPSDYQIVNNSTIIAQLGAGEAGTVPITVTNPAGTSAPYTFTRG